MLETKMAVVTCYLCAHLLLTEQQPLKFSTNRRELSGIAQVKIFSTYLSKSLKGQQESK